MSPSRPPVSVLCVQCCRQSWWAPPALMGTVNVLLAHVSARGSPVGIHLVRCWLGGWVAICPRSGDVLRVAQGSLHGSNVMGEGKGSVTYFERVWSLGSFLRLCQQV